MSDEKYKVEIDTDFTKALKKIDKTHQAFIINWIEKNLVDCTNPRSKGKALQGQYKGLWRYRIGNYRLVAQIKDQILTIVCLEVGHRKDIYS